MRPLRSTPLALRTAPPSAVAYLLVLLAACERGETATANGPPVPAERQELVVGAGQDDFILEMNRHRLGMYPINANICETLVRLTPELRAEPWLAKSWQYRGDNTYRFTLRRGVAFHDGRPFDAEAVRSSLSRAVRTGIGHSFLSEESVRIVDSTTVDIRPERPNLRLVEQLVHPSYSWSRRGATPPCGRSARAPSASRSTSRAATSRCRGTMATGENGRCWRG